MAEERAQRRLAAILAADVVGYSGLMESDEIGTLDRLKALRREVFAPITAEFGGRIFKLTGDGALAEFGSAADAVNSAVAVQRMLGERNAALPKDSRIELRIGISLGDVIVEGSDLYGNGVNVAARMEGLADPGGVCISGNVYEHVTHSNDLEFEDLGDQTVKNIDRPIRCYRVQLERSGASEETAAPAGSAAQLSDKPSIAVLPFDNLSGDPEQEYFSDGITEDIITSLSRIRQFFVTARNTTFTYKRQAVDVQAVASELGVRYVLEGSVRKSGDRVRITTQLIDGETGNHVWAQRYDRDLEDIFAVQDEITQTVVGALQPEIARSEIERARRKPPDNLNAWDLYQRGLWHRYHVNKEDIAAAIELFSKAIELDPNLVHAYVGLADCYVYEGIFLGTGRNWQDTLAPARKAVEIDPQDANAHRALGWAHFVNRDARSTIAELNVAIELNPSDAHSYAYLGFGQMYSGLAEEALESFRSAMKLSPRDPLLGWFHGGMGLAFLFLQRLEESVESARKALRYSNIPWLVRAHFVSALAHSGRKEECKKALADLLVLQPDCTISIVTQRLPFSDDSDAVLDHYVEGLRKAGMPE
jgi:adenylate cyclase